MEFHVAGILVRTLAADLGTVAARISTLPDTQVHAANDGGKLVLTVEAFDPETLSARIAEIQHVAGVLSAVLVYQHHERLEEPGDGSS